jgi:hypothetical protein
MGRTRVVVVACGAPMWGHRYVGDVWLYLGHPIWGTQVSKPGCEGNRGASVGCMQRWCGCNVPQSDGCVAASGAPHVGATMWGSPSAGRGVTWAVRGLLWLHVERPCGGTGMWVMCGCMWSCEPRRWPTPVCVSVTAGGVSA